MIENKITLCLITCQRLNLFTQTINSFLENCLDLDLIENIILIDDNSIFADILVMDQLLRKFNKPFDMIKKGAGLKGHQVSLNLMYNINTKYILMLEDDWVFMVKDNFIRKSFTIMNEDPSIKQVLLRTGDIMAVNQTIRKTKDGIEYIKYDFPGQFARDSKNRPAWSGWNLNPALWNFEEIKKLGKFPEDESNFEFKYSRKYWKAGYKVAYFPFNHCEHIGEGQSAYVKNQTRK